MVTERKSLVVVLLKSMRNVDIKPLARQRLYNRTNKLTTDCNKNASIRWQDSARRQFQAGLRGDVGL